MHSVTVVPSQVMLVLKVAVTDHMLIRNPFTSNDTSSLDTTTHTTQRSDHCLPVRYHLGPYSKSEKESEIKKATRIRATTWDPTRISTFTIAARISFEQHAKSLHLAER